MRDDGSAIRLGIVGLGAMGAEMLRVADDHPDFVVHAAADPDEGAVRRRRNDHPSVAFGTDPFGVIGSPEIDAVYVASPPAAHAELVIAALDAGKAVFCEKPFAISLEDGRAMLAAAERSRSTTAVNFALADRHAVLQVERALETGQAGHVRGVEVRLAFPRWPRAFQARAGWVAGRAQGGFVREVFSHFAYLTDRLLGPLQPTYVDLDHDVDNPMASEVAARGFLRAGGVPVLLTAVSGVAGPETYEWLLWGTRRSYLLRDWNELLVSDGGAWTPVDLTGERGSEATRLSSFARAIRGHRVAGLADFPAAYRVQRVVEAFHSHVLAG